MKKKTREEYKDGWFHTGDIGRWNKDGTLSIIDRKKNLVKLAHGEYVAVNNLEMLFGDSQWVAPNGICVYGDSFKNNVVAIVCPNIPFLKRFSKENDLPEKDDVQKLCKSKKVMEGVLKSFSDIAKSHKLKKWEFLTKVHLSDYEWSPENGLLTAAMKLQRGNIIKHYKDKIDELYK